MKTRCNANIGTVDNKATCPNVAKFHYEMDKLSNTDLCGIHSKEADNNQIIKFHLKAKHSITH